MPTKAKTRKRVVTKAVDTPDKTLGMKTKKAKVTRARGKYFVSIGARKLEIPVGLIVSAKEVSKLVGKDVFVALSKKKPTEIAAIGDWPRIKKPTWILCNIPAPDMIRRVQDSVRKAMVSKMVSTKIITPKMGRTITTNFAR